VNIFPNESFLSVIQKIASRVRYECEKETAEEKSFHNDSLFIAFLKIFLAQNEEKKMFLLQNSNYNVECEL
jgi:hypothetical protein